jgi:hypothetical protein
MDATAAERKARHRAKARAEGNCAVCCWRKPKRGIEKRTGKPYKTCGFCITDCDDRLQRNRMDEQRDRKKKRSKRKPTAFARYLARREPALASLKRMRGAAKRTRRTRPRKGRYAAGSFRNSTR